MNDSTTRLYDSASPICLASDNWQLYCDILESLREIETKAIAQDIAEGKLKTYTFAESVG